jgi:transcriptional regulator with XRE-family HTH domain
MTGQELSDLRKRHGLTQRTLAELLGYNINYISRLERGDEKITQRFEKLARTLLREKKSPKSSNNS